MIRKFRHKPSGFSLIEIIAVLLLLSISGGILYSYFTSAYVESAKPLERLQKSYDLHMVMENITADYLLNYPEWQKRHPRWQKQTYYVPPSVPPADPMYQGMRTFIRVAGNKGYIYECTVAGKSGNTEPLEFGSGISPVIEGTLRWEKKPDLTVLRDKIVPIGPPSYDYAAPALISNNYGKYMVKENNFIVWDTTYTENVAVAGDPNTILKVTLTNDSGEILTSLFTNLN